MALLVSSNAPMKTLPGTYVSGSGVQITTTRYEWIDVSTLNNAVIPVFNSQIGSSKSLVETNMSRAGQIEKGRNFDLKRFGLRIHNAVNAAEATPEWYQKVLSTLFRYGMVQIKISGSDHIGQFPLALLSPTFAVAADAGVANAGQNALVWVDLGENNIILSEQVDFKFELVINIPAGAVEAAIPAATHVLFIMHGVEVFAQL